MIGELIPSGYTYDQGRNAINDAFSGSASFNSFSANTMISGNTDLYDIFLTETPPGDFTRVQNGLNTYTGGTENLPTINISAATLSFLSATSISATTLFIGNQVFQVLADAATIEWDFLLGSNAVVTLGGNRTIKLSNTADGDSGNILVLQDGVGNRELSLTGTTGTHKVINGGGGVVRLTSNAKAEDILSFIRRSSTFYWNIGYNYN